jgi:hypothetical protein
MLWPKICDPWQRAVCVCGGGGADSGDGSEQLATAAAHGGAMRMLRCSTGGRGGASHLYRRGTVGHQDVVANSRRRPKRALNRGVSEGERRKPAQRARERGMGDRLAIRAVAAARFRYARSRPALHGRRLTSGGAHALPAVQPSQRRRRTRSSAAAAGARGGCHRPARRRWTVILNRRCAVDAGGSAPAARGARRSAATALGERRTALAPWPAAS